MALTLNSAAPHGVSKPYVNSPGANPTSAAAFTKAAQAFYPNVYGGTDATGTAPPAPTTSTTAAAPTPGPVDYQKLLADDPILGQALSGYNAQGIGNQGQLLAGQQRALIQYGKVPSVSLPGLDSIDATTRALADQNTAAGTSTVANLQRAYQQAQQGSDASLAARGLLRSGAYGQHAAENLQGYNQAGYQADQQLSDYLQGLYSGYLQQQQTLQGQGVQATNDALTRIIQQIQAGLTTGGATSTSTPTAAPTPAPTPAAPVTGPTDSAQAIAFKRQSPAYAGAGWTAGF